MSASSKLKIYSYTNYKLISYIITASTNHQCYLESSYYTYSALLAEACKRYVRAFPNQFVMD